MAWPYMTDTRQRILDVSLALFNQDGERHVSTNRIAEALGISPGNLYYHFRNKQDIIYHLFQNYRTKVETFLTVPADRPLAWKDKMVYLEAILEGMWTSRFLHRDLPHLLQQDEQLQVAYRDFARHSLQRALLVYQGLRQAGLIEADDETLQTLLVNTWVLAASWIAFVQSISMPSLRDEEQHRQLLQQGIYQIVRLEAPYLRGEALSHLETMCARYRLGDTLTLLFGSKPNGFPTSAE